MEIATFDEHSTLMLIQSTVEQKQRTAFKDQNSHSIELFHEAIVTQL